MVHARLRAFVARTNGWANEHPNEANPWCVGTMSLSDAIRELLFREDVHAARSSSAAQRARKTDRPRRPRKVIEPLRVGAGPAGVDSPPPS
jgi:hypothetical protein